MKLSDVKNLLATVKNVNFKLPNGKMVPEHFHVTEVGMITKNFIDCGGTVRNEKVANFQLWEAGDFDHRLAPQKLTNIISLSEKTLGMEDLEVEVEYQSDTIGKYDLAFDGTNFILLAKHTNCLASDKCGIPADKLKVSLSSLQEKSQGCCTPGGGCC
jgi:hypothetical protein